MSSEEKDAPAPGLQVGHLYPSTTETHVHAVITSLERGTVFFTYFAVVGNAVEWDTNHLPCAVFRLAFGPATAPRQTTPAVEGSPATPSRVIAERIRRGNMSASVRTDPAHMGDGRRMAW